MKSINLLYVTWGEVIIDNGIFKNQVLEQLKLIKQENKAIRIFLLCGLPLGNARLFKHPFRFFRELDKIGKSCKASGIDFKYRFILGLSPWFYSPPEKLRLYDAFQDQFLKKFLERNKIFIIHCRSYTATRLFSKIRKRQKRATYKLIFDTRGNFPEEGFLKSHLNKEAYEYWKRLEKQLFDEADAIVNVSDTFTEFVRKITDNKSVYTIYTSTNLSFFYPFNKEERKNIRAAFEIETDERILVYSGDLREIGWHQRSNLFSLYKAFKNTFSKTKLLLITLTDKEELKLAFLKDGFQLSELIVVQGSSQQEINTYLNLSDYAALPFKKVENNLDETLGYTMIASKTGEYLAAGLPIIVNSKIGAASKLVKETGTGIIYNSGDESTISECLHTIESKKEIVVSKCMEAAKLFDAQKNAQQYLALYDTLLR